MRRRGEIFDASGHRTSTSRAVRRAAAAADARAASLTASHRSSLTMRKGVRTGADLLSAGDRRCDASAGEQPLGLVDPPTSGFPPTSRPARDFARCGYRMLNRLQRRGAAGRRRVPRLTLPCPPDTPSAGYSSVATPRPEPPPVTTAAMPPTFMPILPMPRPGGGAFARSPAGSLLTSNLPKGYRAGTGAFDNRIGRNPVPDGMSVGTRTSAGRPNPVVAATGSVRAAARSLALRQGRY
jgi:hypothetical protein